MQLAPPPNITTTIFTSDTDPELFQQALAIRIEIFVDEQGVPIEHEQDDFDSQATHILAYLEGEKEPIATGRMRTVPGDDSTIKLERIAVKKELRGQGIGFRIMEDLLTYAKLQGHEVASLHSQVSATAFYEKMNFHAEGDVFLEENIEHVKMTKAL